MLRYTMTPIPALPWAEGKPLLIAAGRAKCRTPTSARTKDRSGRIVAMMLINRLKTLKRAMYGGVSVEVLRAYCATKPQVC
jgi:hypothetical protein